MLSILEFAESAVKDQSQLFLAIVADRIDVAAVIEGRDDVGPNVGGGPRGPSRRRASG